MFLVLKNSTVIKYFQKRVVAEDVDRRYGVMWSVARGSRLLTI